MHAHTPRAFTLIEMAAATALGLIGAACFLAMSGAGAPPTGAGADTQANALTAVAKARAEARQLKDAVQIRGIVQAMVIFAHNNKSQYPLPSTIDAGDATIALGEGEAAKSPFTKNTTANIFSILIFNGNVSTETCISPAEVNKRITADNDYAFASPPTAAKPAAALWDPAFSADFSRRVPGGNFSYAHLIPGGKRIARWADTFSTTEAVMGNRGPQILEVGTDAAGEPTAKLRNEKSKTLRIHGDPKTWEGNIAYNDGHVNFETRTAPVGITYPVKAIDEKGAEITRPTPDNLFFDEKNDASMNNAFLGVWIGAGKDVHQFRGIWD